MSNDLEKTETQDTQVDDSFAGYTNEVEGEAEGQHHGVIRGAMLRYGKDLKWSTRDGEIASDRELIATSVARVMQKWIGEKPVETVRLAPKQKIPNLKKLNDEAPKEQWRDKFGKPHGPWEIEHVVYLIDQNTMDTFTFVTQSVGGERAVGELANKVKWWQRMHGTMYPVVTLSRTHMPTAFGGTQRPHFEIMRWWSAGNDTKALSANGGAPANGGSVSAVAEPVKEAAAAATEQSAPAKKPTSAKRTSRF